MCVTFVTCEVRVCGLRCRSGSSLYIYRVYLHRAQAENSGPAWAHTLILQCSERRPPVRTTCHCRGRHPSSVRRPGVAVTGSGAARPSAMPCVTMASSDPWDK